VFAFQDPVTKAIIFDSSCDPLHANSYGDQVFAMHPDGTGLRQLTDAAGFTQNPDRSIRVDSQARSPTLRRSADRRAAGRAVHR
jgi:hypothetical protein